MELEEGGPKGDVILDGGALEEYVSLEGDGGDALSPENTLIHLASPLRFEGYALTDSQLLERGRGIEPVRRTGESCPPISDSREKAASVTSRRWPPMNASNEGVWMVASCS